MFIDARSFTTGIPAHIDVCVIGAGVAGLVLARGLQDSGLSVWLFESGGERPHRRAQALNAGISNLTDYPFKTSRVRVFGGTSSRWTGACVRLDHSDFDERPWLSHSGWPFSHAELEPYYGLTQDDFGISRIDRFEEELRGSPFNTGDLSAKAVAFGTPLNLGKRYREMIARSKTVNCCLNATAIELFPDASGGSVSRISFRTYTGDEFQVRPRAVVLACGGIENARLLLASNSVHARGLGNTHDKVGRYHMEHPIRCVGILPLANRAIDALPFTDRDRRGSISFQGTFGLSPEARGRERLLDLHVRAYRYNVLEDTDPVISGKRAVMGLFDKKTSRKAIVRGVFAAARPASLGYLVWHVRNKLWRKAKFDHLRLTAFVEQEPDPENRITLSDHRDCNGRPLPHLSYRESEATKASIAKSMRVMATALGDRGFGNLRHDESELAHLMHYNQYGLHQMGSTRMSQDPRRGVVDLDCRVHGFSNLFIAGSSVFPTGGAANPTWTIASLALRLSKYLKERMHDI